MALWLVLEDFAGDIKRLPSGSFSVVLAGSLLDDTLVNMPDALAQGLPAVEYDAVTMGTALTRFLAQGRQPPQQIVRDGNLLALLYADGAVGGGGASFTFRPGVAPSGPNVFNDWATLYAAIEPFRLSGVAFVVSVDLANVGGTFAVPVGAWDFGGSAILAGVLSSAPSVGPTLVLGAGVGIRGFVEYTQALTIDGQGGTIKPLAIPGSIMAVSRGARLQGTLAPLVNVDPGVTLIIPLLNGGSLQNNGSPVVDLAAGASLQVVGLDDSLVTSDAIMGPIGSFLNFSLSSDSANVTEKQPSFLGTLTFQTSVVPTPLATLNGEVPVAAGIYFLELNGGAAFIATLANLVPYIVPILNHRPLLINAMVQWVGTGVLGDTVTIDILVGLTVVASIVQDVSVSANATLSMSVPEGAVPLGGTSEVSVRVTHAGLLGNPPRVYAQPLAS